MLLQPLLCQPLGRARARVERRLLQGFERGQAPVEPLQLALGLLLGLGRLLQGATQLLQMLYLLLLTGMQLFQKQFAAGQLFTQFENGRIFRIGCQ
ncbi:hypothetical protein D3C80_1598000 [compost metagenome]